MLSTFLNIEDNKLTLTLLTYLIDPPSFSQGADSPHVGRSPPAAQKAAPSEEEKIVVIPIYYLNERVQVLHQYSHSREEVHGVTFLLDEVLTILHELPQRHHGVVVDIEFVISRPRLHSNQHDAGVKLLLEDLQNWI